MSDKLGLKTTGRAVLSLHHGGLLSLVVLTDG